MVQAKDAAEVDKSLFEGILETLSNKYSQFDINLQGMSVRLPSFGMSLDFNGLVTVTCHFRDMTEDEKKASASRNVALMSKTQKLGRLLYVPRRLRSFLNMKGFVVIRAVNPDTPSPITSVIQVTTSTANKTVTSASIWACVTKLTNDPLTTSMIRATRAPYFLLPDRDSNP